MLRHLDGCASVLVAATPRRCRPTRRHRVTSSDIEPQSRQLHELPSMLADVASRPQSDYRLAVNPRPATHRRDYALRPDLKTDEPLRTIGTTAHLPPRRRPTLSGPDQPLLTPISPTIRVADNVSYDITVAESGRTLPGSGARRGTGRSPATSSIEPHAHLPSRSKTSRLRTS